MRLSRDPGRWRILFAFLSLAFLSGPSAVAQPLNHDHPLCRLDLEFTLRLHDTTNGLPNPTARSIAQGADGFVWIGTFDGLVRTDGHRAFPVEMPSRSEGKEDHAIDMLLDDRGSFWVATESRLLCLLGSTWTIYDASNGFDGRQCRNLVDDMRGGLYIRCENGVFHFDGASFSRIEMPFAEGEPTPMIATDSRSHLFAVSQQRFVRLENGAWRTLETIEHPELFYSGIARARDGGIWITTRQLLRHFDGERFHREHAIPHCSQDAYSTILEDQEGTLWLGQYYHGIVRITPDGNTHCSFELEGLPHSHVCDLFEDRQGNIWVGTGGGGALELSPIRFHVLHGNNSHYKENEIRCATTTPQGDLLFATGRGAVFRLEDGVARCVGDPSDSIGFATPLALGACQDGSYWLGTYDSLLHRTTTGEVDRRDIVRLIGGISCLLEDSSSRMWVGGTNGCGYVDHQGQFAYVLSEDGDGDAVSVRAIASAANGTLWFATSHGVLRIEQGDNEVQLAPGAAATVDASNVSVDSRGDVWICLARGGLLRIRGPEVREFSAATHELPSLQFAFFIDDRSGNHWAGSFAGIHRFPSTQFLDSHLAGGPIECVTYDARDGLRSTNFGASDWPPVALDSRGTMFVPSTRGLIAFDPADFQEREDLDPHSIAIMAAFAESHDGRIDLTSQLQGVHLSTRSTEATLLELPASCRQFSLDLGYPDLSHPERVRIQYRVMAEDATWHDVPQDRKLTLLKLTAGTHMFELRARGSEGRWSPRSLRIAFRIPTPWQQRPELQIVAVMVLMVGTGLVGFRLQTVRLRRARERVDVERSRAAERLRVEVDRRALEAQVRQAQKLEAIGTLAGGIAHDFNNVLTAIMGHTELASLDLPPDAPAQQHLSNVLNSSERAREVVRQLLTFGRRSTLRLEVIDVCEVVREAMKLIRASIPKSIVIDADACDRTAIRGDRTQLHQILLNLITNAAQAVDSHSGRIAIRVRSITVEANLTLSVGRVEPGEYICLEVEDNGRGMQASTLERIFEPFFSTKPAGQGTGLGLSVVHGIVADHAGAIEVESTLGEGTRFAIYLPATRESHTEATQKSLPRAKVGRQQRILLVDDEPRVLSVTGWMLERLGYSIDPHYSAEHALEAIVRSPPNHYAAILTDFTMPGMNGMDFAVALRQRGCTLPIVMMSGNLGAIPHEAITITGIEGWIAKPYTRNEIGLVLHRALGGHLESDESKCEPSLESIAPSRKDEP